MKVVGDLPQHMCLCIYHANFIEAVSALHSIIPSVPDYELGFVQKFLCEESNIDCWFGNCDDCEGITVPAFRSLFVTMNLTQEAKWMEWKKNANTNRTEKQEKKAKLTDLIAHITSMSTHFLRHSYVKRAQSTTFTTIDRSRATSKEFESEATLQLEIE